MIGVMGKTFIRHFFEDNPSIKESYVRYRKQLEDAKTKIQK
ncbi:hypothetical protein [Heyndrickxia acidicola]|uniref:Uncharacterized protein n=1 Tax=Heyndrickxia acidicola TaxID=209389 RepID=A0ABU6MIB7_9BACI|nr:hypothetical protein [Heyndrickxia acidicola]MED1204138.1 hypothetical protein [Heyndrickxia acidicola]